MHCRWVRVVHTVGEREGEFEMGIAPWSHACIHAVSWARPIRQKKGYDDSGRGAYQISIAADICMFLK